MAGAGYRTFTAGAILTAAQVQNYLQDQVVQVYADSTARSAALGTSVAEGMMSYLTASDQVSYYNGSLWAGLLGDTNAAVATAATSGNYVRNITLSTATPTGGNDGDVWLVYLP